MEPRTTLVLGASPEPSRYAYLAAQKLLAHGHRVVLVGKRSGTIGGVAIGPDLPAGADVDTVTLYLNPVVQEAWHDRLLQLAPRRIIFNPGTEHPAFAARAAAQGIEVLEACTLVMLGTGQY
ncbi:MAG: CoA-binding protein [Flavobacteriales bacterium]|nr:CoA-binding protein [Flavobacteriales bacterium]